MVTRRSLVFTAPRQLEIRAETLPPPGQGQARVRALLSAISAGTEMLVYTGLFPQDLAADETIAALDSRLEYPLKYGYSMIGEVVEVGSDVSPDWIGRKVFAFHPHEEQFIAPVEGLQTLPEDIAPEDAAFLPNMETAVNLVMDGRPLIGERVGVVGQGVVGLLTVSLLSAFPLARLVAVDALPRRRTAGRQAGAAESYAPDATPDIPAGLDLCFELSGSPAGLNLAIQLTGFEGRVVIGSWYGRKPAALDLGGRFHRSRIRLISSQVSSLASEFHGRWDKARRFELAWEMLRSVRPSRWITHRFPFDEAAQAYRLLADQPQDAIQVLLTYP